MFEGVMPKKMKLEVAHQSTEKRKSSFTTDVEHPPKRVRLDVEEADVPPNSPETDFTSDKNTYSKGGLANVLPGIIYQLKLLMLFVKRALDENYQFYLGTEVKDAGKFDDIVLRYKLSEVDKVCFIQAKHREDESKKVTSCDLLKEKGDFSLQKYFKSYSEIKNNRNFDKLQFEGFILCTNIDFDFKNLEKAKITPKIIEERDDILDAVIQPNKVSARYKLNIEKQHDLYEKLRETSDMYLLAKQLAQHVTENKRLQLRDDILRLYHVALCKEANKIFEIRNYDNKGNIIVAGASNGGKEVKAVKFHDAFLNGNDISEEVRNLRNALKSALGKQNDDSAFKELLNGKELSVSLNFGEVFKLQSNPTITAPKELAKEIAKAINESQKKGEDHVNIKRERGKTGGVIKDNIEKLAGHLLVLDGEKDAKGGIVLYKFSTLFLGDDDSKLPGNLKEFSDALKKEISNSSKIGINLKTLKFKINNFNTCYETSEGELLLPKDVLPSAKVEDEEIEGFFDALIFAVNQPNEVELGEIIVKELGESSKFNLLNAGLVADSFQRSMLEWFKAKGKEKGEEGVWLNAESGGKLFGEIEKQVGNLISLGMILASLEKFESYGIMFDKRDILDDLKNFLSTKNAKIFHLNTQEGTILSTIKICSAMQHLKTLNEFAQYKSRDSYILMPLSTLLVQTTQEHVMEAFRTEGQHNLFIIECESAATDQIKELFGKLNNVIKLNSNKKIIFITTEDNNALAKKFENIDLEGEDETSFNDLNAESQQKLLAQEVILQGSKVSLNKLIDASDENINKIIDIKTLIKLVKGEEINIGRTVSGLDEVRSYYVERRVRQVIILDKEKILGVSSESDVFVISDTDSDSGLDRNSNIHVFPNAVLAAKKFKELCETKTGSNIHYLKSYSKKLSWLKSYGSISNLIRCKIKTIEIDNARSSSLKNVIKDNHKIVIISDTAGMGKSVVLTSLSMELKEKYSSLWVIKINLNDHTTAFSNYRSEFSKLKFTDQDNIARVVDFLYKLEQSNLKTELEQELFKNSFNNNGKIALLFDGFDEISPEFTDIVIYLLQSLKKSKVEKLFVTTRPSMCEKLEEALGVFSHALDPLLPEEQSEFLFKFWTRMLKLENADQRYTERLQTYAESIIKQIAESINDKKQGFIAIPLHIRMVAEVFQEYQEGIELKCKNCKEFLESKDEKPELAKNFALLDLYEIFVKKKFYNIFLGEKQCIDLTKSGRQKRSDAEYKEFKDNYAILAVDELFSEKQSREEKKLLSEEEIEKVKSIKKNIESGIYNEGIVDQIIKTKAHFIHRTFTEYFASFSIAQKIPVEPTTALKYIEDLLLNTSPIFIDNIINQLNGKQDTITASLGEPLLHFVTINTQYSNFIKSLLRSDCNDWAKKLDTEGKTPLHYAIEKCDSDTCNKLLNYADDIGVKDILKHGGFAKPEYENSKLVKFINIQDDSSETALCYAIHFKNLDFAFELLLKGASVESLPDDDVEKLTRHMLYKRDYDYAGWKRDYDYIYNTSILEVYANQENKYRPIQEKLLLKTPDIFNELNEKDQSRLLSYFFVHGRVQVIEALLEKINDLKQRKEILNSSDNSITPLDRVNTSDKISDDDRLKITEYLLTNGGTEVKLTYPCDGSFITKILVSAAERGHIETFKYFIGEELPENYEIHLQQASKYNQYDIIRYLNLNQLKIDPKGNTVLHITCNAEANLKIIKYLIDSGRSVDVENNKGETPLFRAICARNIRLNVIEYLVTQGANVNHEDNFNNTPLSCALRSYEVDAIKYLLKQGARISDKEPSPTIKDMFAFFNNPSQFNLDLVLDLENGYSRLHTAIKNMHTAEEELLLVKFLMFSGADVNKADTQGKTPLHLAAERGKDVVVQLLLQYGAFFDKEDRNQKTPRDYLSSPSRDSSSSSSDSSSSSSDLSFPSRDLSFLSRELSSSSSDLSSPSRDLSSPSRDLSSPSRVLWWTNGHHKIVWLLDVLNKLFSSNNLMQDLNETFLESAERGELVDWGPYERGHPDDIDNPILFILNSRNAEKKTLLHIAAGNNDPKAINTLLRRDRLYKNIEFYHSSVNTVDSQGNTPLHIAAQNGHGDIVSLLLENDAIFNKSNSLGNTPKELATNNNLNNIVKLLLPTINLFSAIQTNDKLEVENCIKAKAYINAKDQSGKTALHLAASFAQFDVLQLLLDNGANIKAVDLDGNTPLHIAVETNKIENGKLLLKYGASYNTKNAQDQNPLDLAQGQGLELFKQIDTLFFKIMVSDDLPQVIIEYLKKIHRKYNMDLSTISNIRDNQENTLLHYAAESNLFEIVKVLLENGAIFNVINKLNKTPIELTKDNRINTLLIAIASMFDDVSNVEEKQNLVGIQIIINVRDDAGRGLLHHAAESGYLYIVEFLIENGADVTLKDKKGVTAYDLATQYPEDIDLLQALAASPDSIYDYSQSDGTSDDGQSDGISDDRQ